MTHPPQLAQTFFLVSLSTAEMQAHMGSEIIFILSKLSGQLVWSQCHCVCPGVITRVWVMTLLHFVQLSPHRPRAPDFIWVSECWLSCRLL